MGREMLQNSQAGGVHVEPLKPRGSRMRDQSESGPSRSEAMGGFLENSDLWRTVASTKSQEQHTWWSPNWHLPTRPLHTSLALIQKRRTPVFSLRSSWLPFPLKPPQRSLSKAKPVLSLSALSFSKPNWRQLLCSLQLNTPALCPTRLIRSTSTLCDPC